MCGIAGAVAPDASKVVLTMLKEQEYRGYDSAGVACIDARNNALVLERTCKRVTDLSALVRTAPFPQGCTTMIGHTRWATHGKPSIRNAHPHISEGLAVVHNGIIENHAPLRSFLLERGFAFMSDTDTEVIVHLVQYHLRFSAHNDLLTAVQHTVEQLEGAFAFGIIAEHEPEHIIAARRGSPLVIGVGEGERVGEYYIASDAFALSSHTSQYVVLEHGDVADITPSGYSIYDMEGHEVERAVRTYNIQERTGKGEYPFYMLKEIHEQPDAMRNTLMTYEGAQAFGPDAPRIFAHVQQIHIVACGTSYYAARTAQQWFVDRGVPCNVYMASEYRYQKILVRPGTLFVAISQSGETADTLAALEKANGSSYVSTLGICNAPETSLVRAANHTFITQAGHEQSVASTKAFTTQMTALRLLVLAITHAKGECAEGAYMEELFAIPARMEPILALSNVIRAAAQHYLNVQSAFFLGRCDMYPIALEGALKLKEIAYIHAEAYPAGELKHGPLALIDERMLIVALALHNDITEKVLSNVQEVIARGGQVLLFIEEGVTAPVGEQVQTISLGTLQGMSAQFLTTIALQLFAYHVADLKGLDVDHPRNLAKSVTVE
jgi:glutamine---fructose-6-phosphate transaminase (isomerizing)